MKCTRCEAEKPETEFSWKIKAKGIRQTVCRTCAAAYERWYREQRRELLGEEGIVAVEKARYQKNRQKQLDYHREYYRANKERFNQLYQERYQRIKDTPEHKQKTRARALRNKFGMTQADYDRMAETQNHQCAICGATKQLVVDHCHETGRVRGLLCRTCNSFLGRIGDSVESLDKIKQYLQGTPT